MICSSSKVPHHQKILLSHHKQTDMPGHDCVFVNKFFLRFKRKYEKIKRSNKQVHLFCKQSIQWLVDTFYFWIQYSCMMQYSIWSLGINCECLNHFLISLHQTVENNGRCLKLLISSCCVIAVQIIRNTCSKVEMVLKSFASINSKSMKKLNDRQYQHLLPHLAYLLLEEDPMMQQQLGTEKGNFLLQIDSLNLLV